MTGLATDVAVIVCWVGILLGCYGIVWSFLRVEARAKAGLSPIPRLRKRLPHANTDLRLVYRRPTELDRLRELRDERCEKPSVVTPSRVRSPIDPWDQKTLTDMVNRSIAHTAWPEHGTCFCDACRDERT
jgi:hypothetical protein